MDSTPDNSPVWMRENNDCGVAAVATITGRPYEEVWDKWPGKFKGNVSDSYIHHQGAITRLGLRWDRRTIHDVISGRCKPMRTAILLNAGDDPETFIREDLFVLHWVVLAGVDGAEGVSVHWGDGHVRRFLPEQIREHFKNPFCVAYEVSDPEIWPEDLPWYKRWYKRLTSWIGSLW